MAPPQDKMETAGDLETTEDKEGTQLSAAIASYDFRPDDLVTLSVGPDEQKMSVHGTYLTRDSESFTAALKKEWVEGQTRSIKLPEESVTTMAHYLSHLYSGDFATKDITTLPSTEGDDYGPFDDCYELLASL